MSLAVGSRLLVFVQLFWSTSSWKQTKLPGDTLNSSWYCVVETKFQLSFDVQEREEAVAKEAERQRIAKEKEIARLRSLQERAKDEQAEKVWIHVCKYDFVVYLCVQLNNMVEAPKGTTACFDVFLCARSRLLQ